MYAVTVTALFKFYIKPRIQNRENLRRKKMKLKRLQYFIIATANNE